jgi:hypothetical protein
MKKCIKWLKQNGIGKSNTCDLGDIIVNGIFTLCFCNLHLSPNHQSLAIFQEVSLIGTCVLAFTFGGHFQPLVSCLHMHSTTIQLTPHFE